MSWLVRAETHRGSILTLRSGFATEDEALDFPVVLRHWRSVWVEEYQRPARGDTWNEAGARRPRSS